VADHATLRGLDSEVGTLWYYLENIHLFLDEEGDYFQDRMYHFGMQSKKYVLQNSDGYI
jgi:hypothetical protein